METTDLRTLFNNVINENTNRKNKRIEEGKARERKWLERTKEFFKKIQFLNEYGFRFYISVEDETGCTSYPGQKNVYIRSKATHGYIIVREDGTIQSVMCFVDKSFTKVEDFVKAMASCIR